MSTKDFWVWMDGAIRAAEEATVPVLDHGFLYGDSIYETVRSYDGRIFALDAHLDRLEASARAIRLALPWSRDDIAAVMHEAVSAGPQDMDVGLRLIITRGVGPLGLDSTLCEEPRLLVFGWPLESGLHARSSEGVKIVVTSIRRNPPSALDPQIKSGNFLNNILAYQEAKQRGAFEGVLLAMDGTVAEGTTSNVFWVRDGVVQTSTEVGILLGVTRKTVLDILVQQGIPHLEGGFPSEDLCAADEAFITSTLKGILPVASIEGRALPVPGPLTRRVVEAYEKHVRG